MEVERAHEILRTLGEGNDPYSENELSINSPYRHGDTVRALDLALEGLRLLDRKRKKLLELPVHSGSPWSKEEDQDLIRAYKCGQTIKEIARKHQRTEGAIQSRLLRLGVT